MPIDPTILEILVCPQCKGTLVAAPAGDALVCERCRLRYPVVDDIPQMLVEEAEPLEPRG
jgi:uncharacterized protein YbaR (Trm112 family)